MFRMIGLLGCLLLLTISLGISSTWSVNKALSLDGNAVDTGTFSGARQYGALPVQIGRLHNVRGILYFNGLIDEARIWNIARTQEEIQDAMYRTLTADEINSGNLVGYWNFDNGTANDSAPYENHGTLMGDAEIIDSPLPMVNYYAIIAGVADYPGTGNDLRYTDDDAIDLQNSLLLYSNWEEDNIQLLLDSEANKSNIQTAIETMGSMTGPDDVCLLFFSGHGTNGTDVDPIDESDGLDEYICAYDENIRDDELSHWLAAFPTTSVVVIIDTCFSGGQIKVVDGFDTQATKGFTPKVLPGTTGVVAKGDGFTTDIMRRIGVDDMDDNPGCVVLGSCDDNELSWEIDKLENGLFSYFVVNGLEKNVDKNKNGELSVEEMGKYTKFIVNFLNKKMPFLQQHPQLYDDYPAGMPKLDELAVCLGEPLPTVARHNQDVEDIAFPAAPADAPESPQLYQNYSNPFNPDTWIPYQLSERADVTIRIYNVSGQVVRTLDLGDKRAGFYLDKAKAAYWDGKNETGESLASGVYFYQLEAGDFTATGKMLMVK